MDSNTKIAKSYVSHEEVKSAMEQFLASGGKITKVEDPCQEILLKHDMAKRLWTTQTLMQRIHPATDWAILEAF